MTTSKSVICSEVQGNELGAQSGKGRAMAFSSTSDCLLSGEGLVPTPQAGAVTEGWEAVRAGQHLRQSPPSSPSCGRQTGSLHWGARGLM